MNELKSALEAIRDGYDYTVDEYDDSYIVVVDNPYFVEDNGSNPNLVFEVRKEK